MFGALTRGGLDAFQTLATRVLTPKGVLRADRALRLSKNWSLRLTTRLFPSLSWPPAWNGFRPNGNERQVEKQLPSMEPPDALRR